MTYLLLIGILAAVLYAGSRGRRSDAPAWEWPGEGEE